MDNNKDGKITRHEYANFYKIFVEAFQQCDKDADMKLSEAELKKCLPTFDALNLEEKDSV